MNKIQMKDFIAEDNLFTIDRSQLREPPIPKITIPSYVINKNVDGIKKKAKTTNGTKKFKAPKKKPSKVLKYSFIFFV